MTILRKLGWLLHRSRKEEELADELRFHLEEEAEERRSQTAARRDLGNVQRVAEDTRAEWSWVAVEQLIQDIRYAARTFLHNRAFTSLAALSLALGIGASTAVYSFMDALMLRLLPVRDPASLAVLNWRMAGARHTKDSVVNNVSGQLHDAPDGGRLAGIFPYPAFELIARSNNIFSNVFAYHPARKLNVIAQGQAEVANGEYVSGGYFNGLGVVAAAGRVIIEADDRVGAPAIAVLSYGFAQRRFGSPANAAGQEIRIGNVPFTIAGVAPAGFHGIDPAKAPDFYLPLHADLLIDPRGNPGGNPGDRYRDDHYYWIEMMGRLKSGVTLAQAQTALAPVFGSWVASTVVNDAERQLLPALDIAPGSHGLDNLRRQFSRPFYVLLAMVGLILAIACANIANLLLARAASRRREMAVRLSIGAGRWRVMRQLLTESVLLASLGGAAGMIFAFWGIRLLTALLSSGAGNLTLQADLNWHVLLVAAMLATMTGLLFGLAPALQATRIDPGPALKESCLAGTGSRSRRRFSLQSLLVISQVAISLLLLTGAGLFMRTLANLQSIETGFRRENLLVFRLNAWQAGYRDSALFAFYKNLESRFAAIPGVRSAARANNPLIGAGAFGWPVVPAGKPKPEHAPTGHGSGFSADATRVLATGPGFFQTTGIRLLGGREFDERDRQGGPRVAVVNEAWTRINLNGLNPVGQHILDYGMDDKPVDMEIAGLVVNAKYDELTGEYPAVVYVPVAQYPGETTEEATFFLRTAGDPLRYASAVREIVRTADSRIPITGLMSQAAQIEGEMEEQTMMARLCTIFAALSLAIACVGLYGTTSYTIARRTGEIGIRMALGAQRATVLWAVLRDVLVLAAIGLSISAPLAAAAAKAMESFLYGVKPGDPRVLAGAAAILLAAATCAAWIPARRASRIDPMHAVRHE